MVIWWMKQETTTEVRRFGTYLTILTEVESGQGIGLHSFAGMSMVCHVMGRNPLVGLPPQMPI